MNILTKTVVALACCIPMASFASVSPYQQKALNQLKLINDCAGVAMKTMTDEFAQSSAVTADTDVTTLTAEEKMCNGVVSSIAYTAAGVLTVTINSAAPVIPAFRSDEYTFNALDQAGAALSATSTSIDQWNCTYTPNDSNSNAATFKAYGATASNLLKANPEQANIISMCSEAA